MNYSGYVMESQEFPKSLMQAIRYFADPDVCVEFVASMRWPQGVTCPHCEGSKVSFLKSRRIWKCMAKECHKQFSAKTGTIFEDSPISLDKWMTAIWLVVNCKNGISSYELARDLKLTQKSAWFVLHRVRVALADGDWSKMGGGDGGPVEVDETYIGGKIKNMHTDQHPGYYNLDRKEFVHDVVNHLNEYVRGQVHTQGIENFWSLLKRSLGGTYVAVEPFHLDAYVTEQMFRYNNRATKDNPLNDADRFVLAVSQIAGKRLTYAELTGKVEETGEPF